MMHPTISEALAKSRQQQFTGRRSAGARPAWPGPAPARDPAKAVRDIEWSLFSTRGMTMCQHQPPCPPAGAPDREAARTVASHPEQGWSLLCNRVVLFDDGGELLPDGRSVEPPGPFGETGIQPSRVAALPSRA